MDEQVLICKGGELEARVLATEIPVPDYARYYGLFSDDAEEQKMLRHAETTYRAILEFIRTRDVEKKTAERFRIDVPDLYALAIRFPPEDKFIIMRFWATLTGLVQHFIPNARVSRYKIKGNDNAGVKYIGVGWYTGEPTTD